MKICEKYKNGEIELPVLPKIVQEIQSVIKNPVSTADNLIRVIERDAAISIRLISIANSPIYRGTDKYTTVREAVPRLGVKEIQNIISAIATKSLYETKNQRFRKLMEKLWFHALASGYCARAIAKNLMFGDQDKIFFMGLLHDVGKLPLLKSLSEVFSNNESPNMEEVVSNVQAIHSSFGGIMLDRWGFGKEYIEIAKQHDKEEFPDTTDKAVLIVSLANLLTRKLGYSLFENDAEDRVIADQILEQDSDIIAFSAYPWNVRNIKRVCGLLKEVPKRTFIVLGGPYATYTAESWIREGNIDLIVKGEGEEIFCRLLDNILRNDYDFSAIANLVYRENGTLRKTHADHSFDPGMQVYPLQVENGTSDVFLYETSRGCPFQCRYCSWDLSQHRKIRFYPKEKVEKDLRAIFALPNIRRLIFCDSDLFVNRTHGLWLVRCVHELNAIRVEKGLHEIGIYFTMAFGYQRVNQRGQFQRLAHRRLGVYTAHLYRGHRFAQAYIRIYIA